MYPHKFVFTCDCKNKFFVTAENLSRDNRICCPNCKYEMPKAETEHIITAAKEIVVIDEANAKIKGLLDFESGEIQMGVEIKSTMEDCPLMGKFAKGHDE